MQQQTTGTQAETPCGSTLHAYRGDLGNVKQIWAARPGRWHS